VIKVNMVKIYFTADSRYKIDRSFVKKYLSSSWCGRELPEGVLSIAFVGSRKARDLAKRYLKDDVEHPVLTFPYLSCLRRFPQESENLLGEIIICYPQVSLYAAEKNQEINTVISHFIDHALTVMATKQKKN
jgi:rRNA maturation RNase YbeY